MIIQCCFYYYSCYCSLQLGMLIGTVLSPYIFDAVDYYGCYGLAISFNALVTIYFLFVIKEIPKPSSHDASKICEKDYPKTRDRCDMVSNSSYPAVNGKAVDEKQNSDMPCCNFFSQIKTVFMIAVRSFIDMVAVVLRKRKGRLQILILLIMSIYALFWFAVEEMLMQYNYLLATFPGFDDEDMAWFSTASYMCSKYVSKYLFVKEREIR